MTMCNVEELAQNDELKDYHSILQFSAVSFSSTERLLAS